MAEEKLAGDCEFVTSHAPRTSLGNSVKPQTHVNLFQYITLKNHKRKVLFVNLNQMQQFLSVILKNHSETWLAAARRHKVLKTHLATLMAPPPPPPKEKGNTPKPLPPPPR